MELGLSLKAPTRNSDRTHSEASELPCGFLLEPAMARQIELEHETFIAQNAPRPMDVIFQQKEWIIVNKPPLLLTVPDRTGRPSLGRQLQAALDRPIYPVHRLDFGVTGLVLFAHSVGAQRVLSTALEKGLIRKTYEAITSGTGSTAELQRFENRLVRGKKRSFEAPYGKHSVTLGRVVGTMQLGPQANALQWELHPLTGRPHQLRVQLAMRGYPILGDVLYGGTSRAPFENGVLALRATHLTFDFENAAFGVTRGDYSLDTRSFSDVPPSARLAVSTF